VNICPPSRCQPPHLDSYAYSFQSLFEFASQKLRVAPISSHAGAVNASLISSFLEHLETARGNSRRHEISVLAAIRSFFRVFLQHYEQPPSDRFAAFWQYPSRNRPSFGALFAQDEMQALLDAPDPSREREFETEPYCTCGVRWLPSLRTDSLRHRRCRTSVSEYPRAGQGPGRERALPLWKNDGCGTLRAWSGYSRTGSHRLNSL